MIAEKPTLAQAIAAGIGAGKKHDGYISLNGGNEVVTWCYGHSSVRAAKQFKIVRELIWQSLKNLRDNAEFQGLKNAAFGRSRADLPVGMNLSRAYTIKARQACYESMTVGRVMTPTMALVVRRENEIAKFKAVTYYGVRAIFKSSAGEISTNWRVPDTLPVLDSKGRLLDSKYEEKFVSKLSALAAGNFGAAIVVFAVDAVKVDDLPALGLRIPVGKGVE